MAAKKQNSASSKHFRYSQLRRSDNALQKQLCKLMENKCETLRASIPAVSKNMQSIHYWLPAAYSANIVYYQGRAGHAATNFSVRWIILLKVLSGHKLNWYLTYTTRHRSKYNTHARGGVIKFEIKKRRIIDSNGKKFGLGLVQPSEESRTQKWVGQAGLARQGLFFHSLSSLQVQRILGSDFLYSQIPRKGCSKNQKWTPPIIFYLW